MGSPLAFPVFLQALDVLIAQGKALAGVSAQVNTIETAEEQERKTANQEEEQYAVRWAGGTLNVHGVGWLGLGGGGVKP